MMRLTLEVGIGVGKEERTDTCSSPTDIPETNDEMTAPFPEVRMLDR